MRLVLVIFLAFFLRFWGLGQNPPSLTWDEASLGYNAYSLGIDGRDDIFMLTFLFMVFVTGYFWPSDQKKDMRQR